jgi:flagellar protein FlaG
MFINAVSVAAPAAPYRPASASPAPAAAQTAAPAVDIAAVRKAVASVKEAIKPVGGTLEFNVDQASGKTIVRVVDLETQQVIRQIPSEEMVELARVLERLEGLLLNKHA